MVKEKFDIEQYLKNCGFKKDKNNDDLYLIIQHKFLKRVWIYYSSKKFLYS